MTKRKCVGDHSIHICDLANKDKQADIVTLADSPHFMCMQCGRVANQEKNLCNPLAFDKIPFAMAH